MTDVLSDHAAGPASAAWLAARWWSRPVPEELDVWEQAWPDARAAAEALGLDPEAVEELEAAAGATEPEQLLEEYERLFAGPGRTPCPPYEALWRGDGPRRERGSVMGTATTEVVRLYRGLGLAVGTGAHELPDHAAIEWEALAYALEQGEDEVARALLDEHLALWFPAFCAAVSEETSEPFYAALAGLMPSLLAALSGVSAV